MAKASVDAWRSAHKGLVPQALLERVSYEKRAKGFLLAFQQTGFYAPFVAEYRGREIVGFGHAGLARSRKWGCQAELYAVQVLPAFQRLGLGSRLFEMAVRAAMRQGLGSLVACALEANPCRVFYEKMGGRVLGRRALEEPASLVEVAYGWKDLGQAFKQAESARQMNFPFS
jgi:GNAT superfamily N-acetyltransferase